MNTSFRLVGYRGVRGTGANGSLELSYARILPPTPLTWKNFNTKNWRIDKRTVRKSYATVLIVGAFSTGALKLDTKREQKVLMIGLAGGVLANFLSTIPNVKISITIVDIEPVMKQIATKWFGIKESPTMRIVVQDGVEFVSEEAQKGFDHQPACQPGPDAGIVAILAVLARHGFLCVAQNYFAMHKSASELARAT
ncbi:unnamed protein product [Nippostrongylus brasiliensis]|uniref:PABS domain-containing protein n=1 Tax=Nippostrongylus brasiliensis TaxID=27835 RepID=A0A0N4YJX1_NIPBR|nr:unnamed protein product [Nippostrongylus brasiliensis]